MIKSIIDMLQIDDFYGQSEAIDIAKGKYKIPMTIKDMKKQLTRERKSRLRNG